MRALLPLAIALALAAPARAGERRVAVVAGHHDGGEGTRPLRYATSDAERMHHILTTIGGVAREDAALLADPTAAELLEALARADALAGGGLVFFYFSGHAKDGALRLGSTRLPLTDLRARLSALKARVKVAILDSCKSGELIRTKGGVVGPAFEVSAEPVGPRGLALLASSAGDEDSQESDLLGASFFTHYLASGLLGDADASGDGKVTLPEAYGYAYARTVAQTAEARAGLQHPTYAYDLKGAGEVWITDVARANATLVLPAAGAGSYVVVDAARRTLVAEVEKSAGTLRRIALPAGRYEVKRRDADGVLFARVRLADGDTLTLGEGAMQRVALARHLPKGQDSAGALAQVRPVRWSVAASAGRQAFFAAGARASMFPALPLAGVEVELRDAFDLGTALAVDLSAGAATLAADLGGFTVETRVAQAGGGVSWLREFDAGALQPYVGGRLSLVSMTRRFPEDDFAAQYLLTAAPGLVAGVNWELGAGVSIGLRARASYLLYRTEEELSLGFADAALQLKWEP